MNGRVARRLRREAYAWASTHTGSFGWRRAYRLTKAAYTRGER